VGLTGLEPMAFRV